MRRKLIYFLALLVAGIGFTPSLVAQDTIGYLEFDLNAPGAEFDILNITGVNSGLGLSPDTFPVTSKVDLSNLALTVTFATGPNAVFGSSYFTLNPLDGISFNGTAEASFTSSDPAVSATLTGTFLETTLTLSNGSTVTVLPTFSSLITDHLGLGASDYSLITATPTATAPTPPAPPATPEPESLILVGTAVAGLAARQRRFLLPAARSLLQRLPGAAVAAALALLLIVPAAAHATVAVDPVKLATAATPSTGLAGYNSSTITGSGFPPGSISPGSVTIAFSATCGGPAVASTTATSVTPFVATTDHVAFLIPASLPAGNYYISISGASTGGIGFVSVTCAQINVTATTTTLAACVPTSSLAVTTGANVTAYVPRGSWYYGYYSGIEQVPLEGSAATMNFATPGPVNSCAANSVTGEVVCTENTTNVDLISSGVLTTLHSGSNAYAEFTGGGCENCGVAINPSSNTAVIAMGVVGGGYGAYGGTSGVQVLNLATNTFATPFPIAHYVSEDISIDSGRNLILSPGETGYYDLLKIGTGNTLTEYGQYVGGTLDSAAEDCTTGIALSTDEFSDSLYITDLTQAAFAAGSPGTWTAPGQYISLNDYGYSAGTSGVSSAPGTSHLAVVTGEFGGQAYSALLLPSTSGTGTPTLADYAYVQYMPTLPNGASFNAGFDPHTVTAYTSPNNGKAYAVFADYNGYAPDYLAIVDLACVLAQPRTGAHIVTGTAAACTRYVAVPAS